MFMPQQEDYDYLFKIVLIGDSGVGKSSILTSFKTDGTVSIENTKSTIGVEFATKSIQISDKIVKLQVWDTAGTERYSAVTSAYYRGAVGSLLVYDVTNRNTFTAISKWMGQLQKNADSNIIITLVGNKADLETREISTEEGETLAKSLGISFIETSAQRFSNIVETFNRLSNSIYQKTVHTYDLGYIGHNIAYTQSNVPQTIKLEQPNIKSKTPKLCCSS